MTGDSTSPHPGRPGSPPRGHQGFVVVGSVLALLFVVMGVTATGLRWGSTRHDAGHATSSSTTSRRSPAAGVGARSSTTVIVGATTLFVTTTVPLTTTTSTSTTTTTPKKGGLQVLGGPLVVSAGSDARVLVVANTSKKAFTWDAESSLTGLALQPASGRLRSGGTQQMAVLVAGRITPGAHGVIRFSSSAGDSVAVGVTVRGSAPPPSSLSVSGPALSPGTPDCSQPVQVSVQVSGGIAASVVLTVQQPAGLGQIAFSPTGGPRWVATVPAQPAGTGVSGSITARAADGRTAHASLQYVVTHAGSC